MDDQPLKILHSVFGYERFRAPQEEVIGTLMAGRDALVLMPTGGGKSLCYQIPAIARPGTGVVVSPLIALLGLPCGQVVSVIKKGDNDHIATCQDGNRYRVFLNAEGRVVAEKQ